MITLQNLGDSILFTFDENDKYLNNGTISVPMNSLILVTDDSDMATFRKSATNDIFVSALYSDFGMTKAELEQWYAENMVSEVTEEDVDEKIAEAVGEETDRAVSAETALSGAIDAIDAAYKAADSVISGAVDNLSTALQNESQRAQNAESALSGAIDAVDAAYKAADSVISGAVDNLSTALQNESQRAVSAETALSGAIDTKIDESAITSAITSASTDSEIPTAKAVYDALQESGLDEDTEKLISGSLNDLNERKLDASAYTPTDLTNYYTKSETSGATEISTALNAKQDTLVSGTNIKTINNESILGSGNIDIQGGGKAVSGGTNISITTGETADTINCTLPISAGTVSQSIVAATQPNHPNKATEGGAIAFNGYGYYPTSATGVNSLAQGQNTLAQGRCSHAEGDYTKAIGYSSHSEGTSTSAMTDYSHAEGGSTKTTNKYEHASGQYNNSVSASTTFGDSGNTLFSVGNGTADNARHNAFEIRQNGDIYLTKDGQDVKLQDQLGGGSVTVDPSLDSGSTNPVANSAITEAVIIDASNRDSITSNDYGGFKTFYATQVKSISFTKGYSSAYIEGYILLDDSATKYVFSSNTSSSTTLTDAVTLNLASKTASITVKDRNAHTIRELYMQIWYDNTKQDSRYIYNVTTVFNPPLGVNKAEFVNKCQHYGINVTNELIGGGSSYTAGNGIDITNDVISVTGKVDTSAFTAHTADTTIHVTSSDKTSWNGAVTDIATVSAATAANTTALGGLSLVKLTQAEYSAMEQAGTLDNSTLYVVTDS